MFTKKLLVAALAVAALGASSAAQAGLGVPQQPTAAKATAADFPPAPGKTFVIGPDI